MGRRAKLIKPTWEWIVVRAKLGMELVVMKHLARAGIKGYLPKIWDHRNKTQRSLFGPYLFVWIADRMTGSLRSIKGLAGVVMGAGSPATISKEFILECQARENEHGNIVLDPVVDPIKLRRGQKLKLTSGSFSGHFVSFDRMTVRQRMKVLFTFLGQVRELDIGMQDATIAA